MQFYQHGWATALGNKILNAARLKEKKTPSRVKKAQKKMFRGERRPTDIRREHVIHSSLLLF